MAKDKAMNLKQKLLNVSKAIVYLKKDKQNKMQGYNYLSEAKIKEVIKSEFEKQGILFNYSTHNVYHYEISPTHKGTKQFCTIAEGTYRFIDVDSDIEIVGSWAGSGTDTGDKGLYKAITGGIKYILNTNFLIPAGDDPEDDHNINNGESETKDEKPIEKPKTETSPKKSNSITASQQKAIDGIKTSHLLTATERENLDRLETKQEASEFLGTWWDNREKDLPGEHTKRMYIEEYIENYMKQEDKAELSTEFEKVKIEEARGKIANCSLTQIKIMIRELKENSS